MNAAQRAVTVAASTVLFVGVVVGAASADSLSDILERARTSTYSADRLIVSVWGGETQVSKSFVE
ncbi:MAG: hypothetical protein KDB69_05270, partial [Acidimicrobiia bacterium]|nr:hypothetical protein [Acidimicrobiia bacterium]